MKQRIWKSRKMRAAPSGQKRQIEEARTEAAHAVNHVGELEATQADLTRQLDTERAGAVELRDDERWVEEARSDTRKLELLAQETQARAQRLELQVESLTREVQGLRQENSALESRNEQILRYAHILENSVQKKRGLLSARFLQNYLRKEQIRRFARFIPGSIVRSLQRANASSLNSTSQVANVVRTSGLFDPDNYREHAGPSYWRLDPALHYVLVGERLGIPPSARFDPTYYGDRYPDVVRAGMCLLAHYVEHGRREGRQALPAAKRNSAANAAPFRPERESIILVSHEASRTGAPILALTIGQNLCARYNLVTILLRGGDLVESFRQISFRLICLEDSNQIPLEFKHGLSSILGEYPIRYAILNSIECKDIVPYLGRAFIPTVNLINEFSSYTRPLRAVREALGWTTELVFSSQATADSFCKEHPALLQRRVHILRQGRCSLPASTTEAETQAERIHLQAAMRPPGHDDALVVLGAGSVHIRKGVDLFIASAKAALRLGGKRYPLRFVWIGHGYDPERD